MNPQNNNQSNGYGTSQQSDRSIADTNSVQSYASNVTEGYRLESLEEPLEVHAVQQPEQSRAVPQRGLHFESFFSRRKAMIVSTLITALVLMITIGAMAFLVRKGPSGDKQKSQTAVQQDVKIENNDDSRIPSELQGAQQSLLVSGDIITRGNLKISNNGFVTIIRVQDPTENHTVTLPGTSGTICLDTNNCGYATQESTDELQGQIGTLQSQLADLSGIIDSLGQITIPPAGVTELNGQSGSVSLQGSVNRINVTTTDGVVTITTPQDLDSNANVQFGNLSLSASGQIRANTLVQTGAGNAVTIDAGSDMITFVAGGRVFQLPAAGGATQTICTTGASCATGSGTAVMLSPGTAQIDGVANSSIFINDTGGGNLIHMQSGGVDRFTITNSGNTTIGGSLTVSGLTDGFVRSTSGALSVVTAINLASEVTGVLPIANGGTGSGTAAGARGNIGAAASGANTDITSTTALNTITPSAALTIGTPLQQFTLQGAGNSSISAGSGVNVTTVAFAAPSSANTITFPALSGTVCISTGNCATAGTAGGDLTGSYPNPTIARLQGANLNVTGSANGQILIYNGTNSRWENATVTGDIIMTGTGVATVVNNAITAGKIADGNVTNAKLQNSSLTVISGSGLLNGGAVSLGSSTTINIGQGDGIAVNADNIAVDSTVCRTTGNCAGSGGGVTSPGGTSGQIAKFTGSNTIANSTLSEAGSTVTATGNVVIQGSNSLSLGTANNFNGSVRFYTSAGTNYVALQASAVNPGSNLTFTLPSAYGINGDCLQSNGTGGLTFASCTGGAGGGVTSIDGQTGVVTISNAVGIGNNITIDDATTSAKGIASFSSTNFAATGGAISIAAGGITSTELATNAVTTGKITDGSVTNAKLQSNSVTVSPGINLTGGGVVPLGGTVTLNVTNSPSFSGALSVTGASSLDGGATIRGVTVSSATATEDQIIISIATAGINRFNGTITNADLTANQTYTLPNASGTICLSTGNCSGAGGGVTATTPGTAGRLAVFNTGQDITSSWLLQNGTTLELDNTRNLSLLGGNISANGTVTGTQLISNVITGTAPLVVTSTTLVSNFNADLLDGQSGSFYQDASNLNTGTVASVRLSGGYTGITGVGTVTAGVWNGTAIADLYLQDNITINNLGVVDWQALNNYPAACAAGQAVTQLGDTITCAAFAGDSGSGNYIQSQNSVDQTANFRISGTGRANTALQSPLFDTSTGVALNIGTTNAIAINLNKNVTVAAGQYLTITGGNTASRPATPTEGMVYFDTTTKQLITYSNGKWQADRTAATKIVAASNSSPAAKDAADYVADGIGDEVEINAALNAASGGKVYLFEGTYVAGSTILIPNNTTLVGSGRGTLIELANLDITDNLIENSDISTGTGVVIQDLRLDGRKDLNTAGVQNGIYFSNMGGGSGSSARQGAKVTNVIINNFRDAGISIASSRNNTFAGNTVQGNNHGFYLQTSSSNNTLTSNTVQGNVIDGILVQSSSDNTFAGNTVQGNQNGFNFSGAMRSTLTGNTITNSSGYGINLQSTSNNNTLASNTVTNSTNYGIYVSSSSENTFTGNSLMSNSVGLYIISSNNSTLTGNNVSYNTNQGIVLQSSNSNLVSGNNIQGNSGSTLNNGIYLTGADSNNITGNTITDDSATTNNYAINIVDSTSDTNYLAGNTLGTGSVNNIGTGTVFGGQVNGSGDYIVQPAGTVELMKNTNVTGTLNVTGNLDTNGSLTVGNANQFVISNTGVVTGGTWQAGTIGLLYGGTNNTSYTTNGIVYSNGTSLVSTGAGTTGQCLLATTGGAPTWNACTATDLQGTYNASSPATILLTNNKDFTINTGDTATDSSIIFNLSCATCSAGGGRFAVQDAGTDIFTVQPNGDIRLGTAANNMTLIAANGYKVTASGTARNVKTIQLIPEYPSAVLDADGSGNLGTMTSGNDSTNRRRSFYNWTTTQGSAQTYDVVVQVPLPSDFDGWSGANPLSITTQTSNITNGLVTLEARDSSGVVVCNYVGVTPGTINTWTTNNSACTLSTGTYSAGDYITLRIKMSATSGVNVKTANILLNYNSKF